MSKIFISYKREERHFAQKLAAALEVEGWSVWWDPKLRAGERFDDAIERALNDAVAVIVLWSRRSVTSSYVRDEASYALALGKLVPVAIEEVTLPFRFRDLHTIRLDDWSDSHPHSNFSLLVRDIKDLERSPEPHKPLGRPPSNAMGVWYGEWNSVRTGRLHSAILEISDESRARLEVSYERNGQPTIVEEVLDVIVEGDTLTLKGRAYEYIRKGASSSYSLDNFSLRPSANGLCLEGVAYLANGERPIVFIKRQSEV